MNRKKISTGFFTKMPGRYGMALFLVAQNEGKNFDEIYSWLYSISKIIEEDPQNIYKIQQLVNSKNLQNEELRMNCNEENNLNLETDLSNNLTAEKGNFPRIILKFLSLLFFQKRIKLLKKITECFKTIIDEELKREEIVLTTPKKLKIIEKMDFEKKFSKLFGTELKIQFEINEKILGGFIIKRTSEIIDASGKLQINLFRKESQKFIEINEFFK